MKVPAFARWSAYLLAGALTLAAAAWVGDDDDAAVVQPSIRSSTAGAATRAGNPQAVGGGLQLALPAARRPQPTLADPFAVRAPAADEGAVAAAAAAAQRRAPPAPQAPPLPFVYLGRWQEHGRTSIFVQREDRSYKIDGPGPLDAEYAVRSVAPDRISLDYLPLGIVQELRLDAAPGAAVARAPVAAPAGPSSPEPEPGEN